MSATEELAKAQKRIAELETLTTGDQITIRRYKRERDEALAEVARLRESVKIAYEMANKP